MALFIINFHQFGSFFPVQTRWLEVSEVTCPTLPPSNKSVLSWGCDWCVLWCVLTYPDLLQGCPSKHSSVVPGVQEGGRSFSGQTGDTWWRANGTEISNISTVTDYKYLTKISQNFLNILVETYTSVCQSVKTGWAELLCQPVWRSRMAWIASVLS